MGHNLEIPATLAAELEHPVKRLVVADLADWVVWQDNPNPPEWDADRLWDVMRWAVIDDPIMDSACSVALVAFGGDPRLDCRHLHDSFREQWQRFTDEWSERNSRLALNVRVEAVSDLDPGTLHSFTHSVPCDVTCHVKFFGSEFAGDSLLRDRRCCWALQHCGLNSARVDRCPSTEALEEQLRNGAYFGSRVDPYTEVTVLSIAEGESPKQIIAHNFQLPPAPTGGDRTN